MLPSAVATPSAVLPPAIGSDGRVLSDGSRDVVAVAASAPCTALVTPGVLGECGEVPVAGNRVVWVVESQPTASAARAYTVRVFTYVTAESGWVEWLLAEDPEGGRWQGVEVAARDLTGDGVAELVVGFRGPGDQLLLSVDVVSYSDVGIPEVLTHPDDADRGSLVFSDPGFDLYAARYPSGEPACCPPVFARSSIAYVDGFLRVTESADIVPSAVPPSEL